ncbi:MAG: tetratricopeptide repeat protein, partial [Candidatus Poribacteria bacterium]|nr:tetratricopeptide repeat protein [Candidatus Poribacteria bacterium]
MDTESKLQEGIELHRNGQLQQAELIYQQILQVNPENAEVLHLLGTIAHQVEKYDLSINLINQAIEIDPNQSSFFNNLGLTLQKR